MLSEDWIDCPKCGNSLKYDHISNHLRKVHHLSTEEAEELEDELEAEIYQKKGKKGKKGKGRRKGISRSAIVATVLVIIISFGVVAVAYAYSQGPTIKVTPMKYDFGDIPQDKAVKVFTVSNEGRSDLVITGISTSCGCTSAVLTTKDGDSPRFAMQMNEKPLDYRGIIAPGETAKLTVTYDGGMHPDSGPQHRVIYLKSNDVKNPEIELKVYANVIP